MKYFIAKRHRLAADLAGILAALCCLVVVAVLLGLSQSRQMASIQTRVEAAIRGLDIDARNVLLRVNRNYRPVCTVDNLARLRLEVFRSTYQADIAVLDAQGRILCTAVRGMLPAPLPVPRSDVVVQAGTGDPYRVNFRVSLSPAGDDEPVTVVASGRFHTVVDPQDAEEAFLLDDGAVWVLTPQGDARLVHADPSLPLALVRRLGDPALLASDVHGWRWSDLAFVSSRRVVGTAYVSQYVMPLDRFVGEHHDRISLGVLLALLLGLLTRGALAPLFRGWTHIDHRIAGLLKERNMVCVYQPIVDLRTGRTLGLEVLVRLRDGADMLLPDQVLPAVVARDLCWELDRLVIRCALRELSSRLRGRHELSVSINLFPRNVEAARLRELMDGERRQFDLDGLRIVFEVIEQEDHSALSQEAARLKEAGYPISLDDFGTGYSNLASLRVLAPQYLKIDKSFVHDMEEASVRSSLIPEIVVMARTVGARLIAEGIENETQRQMLLAHGVDYGQGFLFAKPMEINALVAFLDSAPPA